MMEFKFDKLTGVKLPVPKSECIEKGDISRPTHYVESSLDRAYEPIQVIRAHNLTFSEGNVIKYLLRYRRKDGIKDLIKCKQYLDFVIQEYEAEISKQSKS